MGRKVIIIGPAYPLRGGIANFNEALYRAYEKAGASVEIVSFSVQYPSILFPGKSQVESDTRPDPGLRIQSLIHSLNPVSWLRTARYINQQKPDYVVVRFWLPFMAMSLGSILRFLNKDIRTIALVDNAIPHEKRPGDRLLTRYFMSRAQGFVTMSKSVLNDLSQFTQSVHKRFIPHPVYDIYGEPVPMKEAREALGLNADDKLLLFFGFVRKYKGLNLLLDAMADPRLEAMNVKLVVAGEFYEDSATYLSQIQQNKLTERVILHDHFIPAEDIARYFGAANMVAQTYLSATQSGVTQIAYHFGRPMLVTDVGGLAEIVSHQQAGYVCEQSPADIADAVVDFFEQNREPEMARFVQSKAPEFSWEAMVNGIEELFSNLVNDDKK